MNSFGRDFKIAKKKDFTDLRTNAKRIIGNGLICYYLFYDKDLLVGSTKRTKLAFSISKKFANSVQRNRMKRILRETLRCSLERDLGVFVMLVLRKGLKEVASSVEEDVYRSDFARFLLKINKQSMNLGSQVQEKKVLK